MDQYPALFQGVGFLNRYKVRLNIDESVQPVAIQNRRIPSNLRDKVGSKLQELEAQDIIESVGDIPTCNRATKR